MAGTHVLYRFYSATGQLLYVGITMSPPDRFKSHRDTKEWWGEVVGITLENYGSRGDLEKAERRAIRVERPLYNVVHNGARRRIVEPAAPVCADVEVLTVCGWFKPIWYGTARRCGRTRWMRVAEGSALGPHDVVDELGRVLVTHAPRPDDWIDTVDRFLTLGLSKSSIQSHVEWTMARKLEPNHLWPHFSDCCWNEIRSAQDGFTGVSRGEEVPV